MPFLVTENAMLKNSLYVKAFYPPIDGDTCHIRLDSIRYGMWPDYRSRIMYGALGIRYRL